ncbi:hypothetical protein MOO44_00435 (plasmid) [Nicoliella spurrieriana]|uniref:Uncharacterized protein n=1 Tax=Nicoliella spurrieriana TaxID=2925830 RepID=A0A976X4T4_9LACO|nr:hypothetical protein [Nicoliella spurrieriana]UQS86145.1 hypothetical protein MOO44_00435 [Nicoliella spurrieriana]
MTLKYNTAIVHFIQFSKNKPLFPKAYKFFIPAKLKSSLSIGSVALVQNHLQDKKFLSPVVITGNVTKMNSRKEFKSLSKNTGETLKSFLENHLEQTTMDFNKYVEEDKAK